MLIRTTHPHGWSATLVVALSLAAAACAARPRLAGVLPLDVSCTVLLNGRPIQVSGGSVLDLLSHPSAGRIARAHAAVLRGEPRVLLDWVQLDGVYRLADLPAVQVASISVLHPIEARLRYGPRGSNGAVLVATKRGPSR